jgi:N-acetylneuraminate synthase
MSGRTYIIAEAGVNHNGDLSLAEQLVEAAARAGADAVKFQTFRAEQVVSLTAPKARYQIQATGAAETQLEMVRRLELREGDHERLIGLASDRGIEFLSTPFDRDSLNLLVDRFGLETIKVASGEITNFLFLLAVAKKARRVILSTGMSNLAEVEAALGVLAFGFTAEHSTPRTGELERAYGSADGQAALRDRVTLLHCTTEYPAPVSEANLNAIRTLASAFRLPVGFSDHTEGTHVSIAAVACGATVIEKHFTLDRSLPGPDHRASLEPEELGSLVRHIRETEEALGDGVKRPSASEWQNRDIARRSLVAARPIKAGAIMGEADLTAKRPGGGVSPAGYWSIIGRAAARDYAEDEQIEP